MELIDYITLAIFFALGFVVGWRINGAFHISLIKQLLADLGVTNQQLIKVAKDSAAHLGIEAQEKVRQLEAAAEDDLEQIDIKVEKHGEVLYAFRTDNDQFLGQGASREALIEAMSHRLKNVRLSVVEGNEYMKNEA